MFFLLRFFCISRIFPVQLTREVFAILDQRAMDTTASSSVNSGFVGIKFCQEWLVDIFFIEYLDDSTHLAIICYIPRKIKKIEYYSMQYVKKNLRSIKER